MELDHRTLSAFFSSSLFDLTSSFFPLLSVSSRNLWWPSDSVAEIKIGIKLMSHCNLFMFQNVTVKLGFPSASQVCWLWLPDLWVGEWATEESDVFFGVSSGETST